VRQREVLQHRQAVRTQVLAHCPVDPGLDVFRSQGDFWVSGRVSQVSVRLSGSRGNFPGFRDIFRFQGDFQVSEFSSIVRQSALRSFDTAPSILDWDSYSIFRFRSLRFQISGRWFRV
jgi:hypothetical protein